MKLIYINSMYCNQCFDFRKLMKVNYIERFNLALSVKMEILEVWWLSRYLQSMYADFPSWSQRFKQQGRFGSLKFCLPVSAAPNPTVACCCVTQEPSYDHKKV